MPQSFTKDSPVRLNNQIYFECKCCNFSFTQKQLKLHKLNENTPRLQQSKWFGNISPKIDKTLSDQIDHVFIDPVAFSICGFEFGQLVTINKDDITVYGHIFSSSLASPGEIIINSDFLFSHDLYSLQFVALLAHTSPMHVARSVRISVDCRQVLNSVIEFVCSKLNGMVVRKSQKYKLSVDSTQNILIKIIDIKGFSNASKIKNGDERSLSVNGSIRHAATEEYQINTFKTVINVERDFRYSPLADRTCSVPSNFPLQSIVAVEQYLQFLENIALCQIRKPEIYHDLGVPPTEGCVLYGLPGSGKTSIIYKFCQIHSLSIATFDAEELLNISEDFSKDLAEFLEIHSPDILFIKHVDRLIKTESSGLSREDRVLSYQLESLINTNKKIFHIFTAHDRFQVPEFLMHSQLSLTYREISNPNEDCRLMIIESFRSRIRNDLTPECIKDLVHKTNGFTPRDLVNLFKSAATISANRFFINSCEELMMNESDVMIALKTIQPQVIQDMQVYIPDTTWFDIGGMESVKAQVQECIEWPWRHKKSFQRMNITPPSGILLYGPPGCSKTMIARAISKESGLNFISIRGPELVSMYVGETERAIRKLFTKARAACPCIIFFDEIDSLCVKSHGRSDNNRILAQLLTEIDGVSSKVGEVYVVAATNKPFELDPALIRTGRFDRLIYVPLPDKESRCNILKLKLSRMPVHPDVSIDQLSILTEKYSGSEIVALCREAAVVALREDINSVEIRSRHFEHVLSSMRPRTQQSTINTYEEFKNLHGQNI